MDIKGQNTIIKDCEIGQGTVVWSFVNLFGCKIGDDCIISSFVEIGKNVVIGNKCKIQSFSYIPSGVTIGDEVFIGPRVTFTNDHFPRARGGWKTVCTNVGNGASIAAGAIIICGVSIGENAMVGAGAVVTKDVAPNTVVVGNPARKLRMCDDVKNSSE